jgi:hypothetical protein
MLKITLGAVIASALVAAPALAGGKKKPRPDLSAQVVDGMQTAQENLVRLKVRSLAAYQRRAAVAKGRR